MVQEEFEEKKKMIEEFVGSKGYRSMSVKEMAMVLQVPSRDKKDFREVLDALAREGKISIDLKGKIKPLPADVKVGKYMATQRGFGFVRVEGEDDDIFIPGSYTKSALDGDTVQVLVKKEGGEGKRREGQVLNILERGNSVLVGTYTRSRNFGFVTPDNQKFTKDIYVAKAESKGAVTGHKVVVEITDFGDEQRKPEGRVLEILGHVNDPGVDILSVIKAYGLPEEYPDDVMKQIENIPDEVEEKEKAGRADFRDLQTVTIDGEDAKDLDDAITISKEGNMYHLGVHIADVSQYVTEGSPLDKEALKRGTSIYLVDRVIPMIPHKLSNGICSLNQGVDRLALSCMMDINEKGEIVKHKICESVINVTRRMSYTSVHKIIEEKDEAERKEYEELIPMFELMYELADILQARREKRGSIDFDFPEAKIILDEKGKPIDVKEYERTQANRIIEEFMLAANQTVAEEYFWNELPFVYRTHETPDMEKIQNLALFIENFGYTLKIKEDEIHPKEVQKLMRSIAGKPEEGLIGRLALRSMKQARYTTECEGHFGLALKYYCHFTSPIRRYPDLQIHRIIKENIHGGMKDKRIDHYQKILPEVAEQTSALERRADDAEREVEKMKKAEYMEQFVGKDFEGTISGLTTWGMYVELPNTIEGMIRVADIPGDYYYYDEDLHRMVGEQTGKVYKMGEPLRIIVAGVDKLTRTIDFVLYQEDEDGNPILPSLEKKSPKERISAREKKAMAAKSAGKSRNSGKDGKSGRGRADRGTRRAKERKAKKKVAKRRTRR
ncbi:ribonuclease R [Roseburia sp. CAG:380]|jgi:ribonuclease R|uniref:ribonuclease R n=1 Tax=Roseburia sp. AM59-24XD TaxID=2293138 RepID=UPI0003411241|nr:ribonuclease R [Roseburia sp. AM59-24XD]MBS5664075.1 ribonuclease R [Roseburia sp.]RHP85443.1 ribonuclease R [Roseburia sp. AM59-24XD]CDC92841.1 ribonuclease R [Roseburia sp. CAG:380]HCS14097.1 ribonuclease R [Lachnospiraceae bacterium]